MRHEFVFASDLLSHSVGKNLQTCHVIHSITSVSERSKLIILNTAIIKSKTKNMFDFLIDVV